MVERSHLHLGNCVSPNKFDEPRLRQLVTSRLSANFPTTFGKQLSLPMKLGRLISKFAFVDVDVSKMTMTSSADSLSVCYLICQDSKTFTVSFDSGRRLLIPSYGTPFPPFA